MCNKCCDKPSYAPKILEYSVGDLPTTAPIRCDETSYVPKIPEYLTGTLPTPFTPFTLDSPRGRLSKYDIECVVESLGAERFIEDPVSPYTRDRTAKTHISMEEFLELNEEVKRIDALYLNNPIEYAKTILGEKRVEALLKERDAKNKSIFQKLLDWLK